MLIINNNKQTKFFFLKKIKKNISALVVANNQFKMSSIRGREKTLLTNHCCIPSLFSLTFMLLSLALSHFIVIIVAFNGGIVVGRVEPRPLKKFVFTSDVIYDYDFKKIVFIIISKKLYLLR